jgi:hypothetical protein
LGVALLNFLCNEVNDREESMSFSIFPEWENNFLNIFSFKLGMSQTAEA